MSVTESTYQVKGGIAAAVAAVLAADSAGDQVAVYWGEPPPTYAREFICLMGVQVDIDAATMGTTRTRDETVRAQVNVVVNRQGGSAQKESADRAYDLLAALELYVRDTNPGLGVAGCWSCFVTRIEETGGTPPSDRATGSYTEIIAEFTARVRITK